MSAARTGYAYHFYQHSLNNTANSILAELYKDLGSEKFMGFLKCVTGEFGIVGHTAMATQYRPACFLRTHSDLGETGVAQDRLFAYVLGFTHDWKPDWGGALIFIDAQGNPTKIIKPGFNTLTLFKVPVHHLVSQVANYATKNRHAVTGWYLGSDRTNSIWR